MHSILTSISTRTGSIIFSGRVCSSKTTKRNCTTSLGLQIALSVCMYIFGPLFPMPLILLSFLNLNPDKPSAINLQELLSSFFGKKSNDFSSYGFKLTSLLSLKLGPSMLTRIEHGPLASCKATATVYLRFDFIAPGALIVQ